MAIKQNIHKAEALPGTEAGSLSEARNGVEVRTEKPRVLFVDDEPNVLEGIRRQLRREFDVVTAISGSEGLAVIDEQGEFPVVVSDMRMPEMSGSEFLQKVRERCPNTLRVILTGQADIESTIDAVNKGQIFRFLTKPCDSDSLKAVVKAGLEQYRLINAEAELLENTLSGAVKTLTEVLAIANPVAGRQSARINRYVETVLDALATECWEVRLASMLSQIGRVTMPRDTLDKVYAGKPLSGEEQELVDAHYHVAGSLIRAIPRLEVVANIVELQAKPNFSQQMEVPVSSWSAEQLGGLLVNMAVELDAALTRGAKMPVAVDSVLSLYSGLPAPIKSAFQQLLNTESQSMEPLLVGIRDLMAGMVLDEDIKGANGVCLCSAGQEISGALLQRLRTISSRVGIVEPFRVLAPM